MNGPIGYELSEQAAKAFELVEKLEGSAGCCSLLDGSGDELRKIIELMDVEIASRGKWIADMCAIVGYDKVHAGKPGVNTPSPHDLAKRAVEARDLLKKLVHDTYDITTVSIFEKALKEARAQFESKELS